MPDYYHANEDGTIELNENYPFPTDVRQTEIIETALSTYNHLYNWVNHTSQPYSVRVSLAEGETTVEYGMHRINGGGNGRSDKEHRCQISVTENNRLSENTEGIIKRLFGIYERNNIPVIVAWKCVESTAATNVSKQVGIQAIANAMRDGFSQYLFTGRTGNSIACVFRPEFMYFYLENRDKLHESLITSYTEEPIVEVTNIERITELPHNRIIIGAPGTGKSHIIEEQRGVFRANYERVTFHPNYSYAQFVGTYKPKPKYRKDENGNETNQEYVSYEFVAGPFLRTWIKAQKSINEGANESFLLIVEEINRANVAAVFGDVFQLLDRKSDGISEYDVATSEEMRDYLVAEGFNRDDIKTITIPSNMYLWATMNSADQGVSPMDAAFKRRWHFEYIGINDGSPAVLGKKINLKPYGIIEWNNLRTKINDRLTDPDLNVNEDKLIGPFFLCDTELISSNIDEIFKSKLLMYLFDDVLKHRKGKLFKTELNTFSKIIDVYNRGENIFDFDVAETIVDNTTGEEVEVALNAE